MLSVYTPFGHTADPLIPSLAAILLLYDHPYKLVARASGEGDVSLPMGEDSPWQVDAKPLVHGLTLRLIDSHRPGKPKRKLPPMQRERQLAFC